MRTYHTLTCPICGNDFPVVPTTETRRRCCSRACSGIWQRESRASTVEQFWQRVDRAGDCWLWTGQRLPRGYGIVTIKTVRWLTHRLSWHVTYGPIPDRINVLHSCDNPPCCNPKHLFLGTQADNIEDMMNKGRNGDTRPKHQLRGEECSYSVITAQQAWQIRYGDFGAMSHPQIAATLNVPVSTIGAVRRGKSWKHIGPQSCNT